MNKKGLLGIMCLGLFLALPAAAEDVKDVNFGHISLADIRNDGKDVLVFREGVNRGEPALLNLPIGPGDTVRTSDSRRSEIQFDNGTLIRLDTDSEIKVETILAPSLSSLENVSNIVLKKGRAYIMYTEYDRRELFQILTPNAALKLKNHTVAQIAAAADGSAGVQVDYGKVEVLFGPSEKNTKKEDIRSGESAVVAADGGFRRAEFQKGTEFAAWNKSLNDNFEKTHDGLTPLPKPIQKMPSAVFYFAQKYSNLYGDWIWDQYLGYVWRPFVNDHRYPWGGWRPYYCGQWAQRDGQQFWVPQESWGWVPFHLGIWHWDKARGWVWIPGSAFAPAWVAWDFYFGQRSWRPWTLWDWYFDMGSSWGWWDFMGYWSYGSWSGEYYPWNYNRPEPDPNRPVTLTKISKEQLKGKSPKVVMPIPKDMKGIYKDVIAAFKRGDPTVAASLPGTFRQIPRSFPKPISSPVDLRTWIESFRSVFDRDTIQTVLRDSGGYGRPTPRSGGRDVGGGVAFRFRDWNPDVKIALREGVSIRYDSRTNQVICPQFGISSRGSGHFSRGDFGSESFHSSGMGSDGSSPTASGDSSHSSGSSSHGSSSSGNSNGSNGTRKD